MKLLREYEFQMCNLDMLEVSKPLTQVSPITLNNRLQSWIFWSDYHKSQKSYNFAEL